MSEKLPQLLEDSSLDDPAELLPPPRLSSLKAPPASSSSPTENKKEPVVMSHITEFPPELQVNILTYLRAYDLATVHQTCRFYHDPALVHSIVIHAAERVYPLNLTEGFEQQPVMSSVATSSSTAGTTGSTSITNTSGNAAGGKKGKKMAVKGPAPAVTAQSTTTAAITLFTFEHLRNMELLVVARVLSRPEPPADHQDGPGGYYVSKSWCKTALKWLEWQQERQEQYAAQQQAFANHANNNKKHKSKLSKKQQRLRQRKYSDASPPWPNANSDIVCCHDQLQLCSNRKSARARRKVLDKQAWKCLKKLYPESISLEAKQGECLQCILETTTSKREEQQREDQLKEERKAPLSQPVLRRFYTRTRGIPVHCLADADHHQENAKTRPAQATKDGDQKPSASSFGTPTTKSFGGCPLVPGLYHAIPRAWCHAWRKYMKTGEGGPLLPPDASALLCGFHRLPLLPPHLESYLYGECPQLWLSKKQQQHQDEEIDESSSAWFASSPVARRSVVGLSPPASFTLPSDFGLSPDEMAQQQRAMMTLERQHEQQRQREREAQQPQLQDESGGRSFTVGEQLDRENYCCVEILAHEELEALEKLWPRGTSTFRMSFQVLPSQDVGFSTQACRECDASGMANFCKIPKNSKAHLRAAHQTRVRMHKEHKGGNGSSAGNSSSKPDVQLEY